MSEWISVKEKSPEEGRECRVFIGNYEQEPFYKYMDGSWYVQKDNGVWNKSHFTETVSHYYYCPEPPTQE